MGHEMTTTVGRFLLHISLAGIWALSFAALFYNAVEDRFLNDHLSRYVGLGLLLAVLIHIVFVIRRAILSYRSKRYAAMVAYILLAVILLLIARMGGWVTSFYFFGAAGGH